MLTKWTLSLSFSSVPLSSVSRRSLSRHRLAAARQLRWWLLSPFFRLLCSLHACSQSRSVSLRARRPPPPELRRQLLSFPCQFLCFSNSIGELVLEMAGYRAWLLIGDSRGVSIPKFVGQIVDGV